MPRNLTLFLGVLVFILVVSFISINVGKKPGYKTGASPTYDGVVSSSLNLYKKRAVEGTDFSSGPCLTNDLMPGWVVDVVHSPREKIDDLPQNQCQAYLEGRATHFVELDPSGNLVRIN